MKLDKDQRRRSMQLESEMAEGDLGDYADELIYLRDALTLHRWIPCSERMPEIGENVLICTPSGDRDKGYLGSGEEWYDRFGVVKVTHWQPLPPSPGEPV